MGGKGLAGQMLLDADDGLCGTKGGSGQYSGGQRRPVSVFQAEIDGRTYNLKKIPQGGIPVNERPRDLDFPRLAQRLGSGFF